MGKKWKRLLVQRRNEGAPAQVAVPAPVEEPAPVAVEEAAPEAVVEPEVVEEPKPRRRRATRSRKTAVKKSED